MVWVKSSLLTLFYYFSEDYKHTKRKGEENSSLNDNNFNSSVMLESNSSYYKSNNSAHHIHKRSTSYKRYVEVMIAADYHMQQYHGSNLQRYILTLMAIVSIVFYYLKKWNHPYKIVKK